MTKVSRTQYLVATGAVDSLRGQVSDYLDLGWSLCGGVSYAGSQIGGYQGDKHYLSQAMTRKLSLMQWARRWFAMRRLHANEKRRCAEFTAERQRRRGAAIK